MGIREDLANLCAPVVIDEANAAGWAGDPRAAELAHLRRLVLTMAAVVDALMPPDSDMAGRMVMAERHRHQQGLQARPIRDNPQG